MKDKPATLYIVSFRLPSGAWQVVLRAPSKDEAEYMLGELKEAGEKGRIEEITKRQR